MEIITIKEIKEIKEPKTPVKKTVKEECMICTETMAKSKFVACPYCSFECCKNCTETFLLGLDDNNPRCMNTSCKKVWSLTFITNNFTQTFYKKTYRDRRTTILLEREKSMLPEAQLIIEAEQIRKKLIEKIEIQSDLIKTCREIIKELKEKYLNEVKELKDKLYEEKDKLKVKTLKELIEKSKNEFKQRSKNLLITINNTRDKINELYREYDNAHPDKNSKKHKTVNMKCPEKNCRGFVNNDYVCGLCNVFVCKHCRIVVADDDKKTHECDKDLVATVKLLAKDTKNCPSCTTPIFKINGCDQMYCTQCHTAFSWSNGNIEKGVIHNPHYYQYMRNKGLEPNNNGNNNIRCDIIPAWSIVSNLLKIANTQALVFNFLSNAHRIVGHINHMLTINIFPDYLQNRLSFLRNEIDETVWKEIIKRKQKKFEKDTEVNMVLQMVSNTFKDFFVEFITTSFTPTGAEFIMIGYDVPEIHRVPMNVIRKNIKDLADKIRNICIYANDALQIIKKHYNNVVPYFSIDADMYTNTDHCPPELKF
jgi:hypothetical protein